MIAATGKVALGTVAFLTKAQLKILDGYEGSPYVYARQKFPGDVLIDGVWQDMTVIAYIKQNSDTWYPPSEAYRCAVLRNIRGSFPSVRSLELRDTSGKVREIWEHPGYSQLGLPAFLFEVGVRKAAPWSLPDGIGRAQTNLQSRGFQGLPALAATLDAEGIASKRLAKTLEAEEFGIARALLAQAEFGEDDENDDAQAERATDDAPPAPSPFSRTSRRK